jgi:hypothetical protein
MRRFLLLPLAAVILAAMLVLPASPARVASAAPATAQTHTHVQVFDKTRFLLHLGAAAFLVHYTYKKYKEGKIGRFHIFTDLKVAAALLIAYHELKKAYDVAENSSSKTLQLLIKPMKELGNGLSAAIDKVKHGDTSDLDSLNSAQSTLQSVASKNGFNIKDTAPSGFSG